MSYNKDNLIPNSDINKNEEVTDDVDFNIEEIQKMLNQKDDDIFGLYNLGSDSFNQSQQENVNSQATEIVSQNLKSGNPDASGTDLDQQYQFASEECFAPDFPLFSDSESLLAKREKTAFSVELFLNDLANRVIKSGVIKINNKPYHISNSRVMSAQKGAVEVLLREPDYSQKITFSSYGVQMDGVRSTRYENILINKSYFNGMRKLGEISFGNKNYLKDYVDYAVATCDVRLKTGIMIRVIRRLSFINRYPKDLEEFIKSGFNTDDIKSKVGLLKELSNFEVIEYFKKLHKLTIELRALKFETFDEKLKYFNERYSELVNEYKKEESLESEEERSKK